MPILHLKVNSSTGGTDSFLTINRPIHAQQLTLKRVVVRKYGNLEGGGKTLQDFGGGIQIFLPNLLTGYEINTNQNTQNGIVVPFPNTCAVGAGIMESGNTTGGRVVIYDTRFDMNFSQFDDIPENIRVEVRNYNGTTDCKFDYSSHFNALIEIDLFFEYSEVYDYDTY